MLGMTKQEIQDAVDEWYKNNPDKVASFMQGFATNTEDDDVYHLVSRVMASVGSTVAMHAISDVFEQNNKLLTQQINELIDKKINSVLNK
ncbi:MAG: hypothetical protein GX348_03600 [Veillonellaceae bacterium]|nr:hypothetical protein [Veillonellaceae bacterium]